MKIRHHVLQSIVAASLTLCGFSAFAGSRHLCRIIHKIIKDTVYAGEDSKVRLEDNKYIFPRRLPRQLNQIAMDSKAMRLMCDIEGRPTCMTDPMGPNVAFIGLRNVLHAENLSFQIMLGEDRGQVNYWSSRYYQTYCVGY